MTTAAQLRDDLERQGFTVTSTSEGLRVMPRSRLTPELRAAIRTYRDEILASLPSTGNPCPTCPRCLGPTHRAAVESPGLIVVLCDSEACRWGLFGSSWESFARTFSATLPAIGLPLPTPAGTEAV